MNQWQSIESLPEHTEALVCVTHNVPAEEDDCRPPTETDGYVWETVQWVDWYSNDHGWFRFPRLVEIPFPPTHWMPLPPPPGQSPSSPVERRQAIARCIAIAREVRDGFLSEEYAVGQPLASFSERLACEQVAQAIEKEFSIGTIEQRELLGLPALSQYRGE